jgi:hypothetical protein
MVWVGAAGCGCDAILVMPIPMVRPIIVIEMPVMVVAIAIGTTGSAASHRVFAARWETILRHRQRSATDEQRDDRENRGRRVGGLSIARMSQVWHKADMLVALRNIRFRA